MVDSAVERKGDDWMHVSIEVDQQTHSLLRNWGESEGVGIAEMGARLVAKEIASHYTRDSEGNYHRRGELERFAG